MSNELAWKKANQYCGKLWIYLGALMTIISLILSCIELVLLMSSSLFSFFFILITHNKILSNFLLIVIIHNPFYYIDTQKIIIYIRSDWDEYICGDSSGEESFAAFWVSNFDTLVIPEFFVNSEYLEDESADLYHNNSYIKCYKRNLAFNITLWNKDSLIERYNDAISEELV